MIFRSRLPRNLKTFSLDYRLDIAGCSVFCASNNSGLYVICKGFCPRRVGSSSRFFLPDKKYSFLCADYDETVCLFLDLSKELLSEVSYV